MTKKKCISCGNEFETQNDSDLCFCCTLRDLGDGYSADEEDIVIAKKQSGTLTDEDADCLDKDMVSIEDDEKFDDVDNWEDPECY